MTQPYIPRPYQPPATNYMLDHPRCAVWGFLGCGKTGASLDAIATLNIVEPGPTLVIAPPKVAENTWTDEGSKWEEFEHLRFSRLVGTPDERARALRREADIFTVSQENLPWLMDRLKNDWPFRKVWWDEATKLRGYRGSEQESVNGRKFIRATGGERLRAFSKITHSRIDRFVELTAKPSPNGLKNLWPQMWFLDKGKRLGSTYTGFMDRWFQRSFDGYSVLPLPHAQKEIQTSIADICMSLDEKDYFDLDEPIVTNVYVDLPAKARSQYKDMEKNFYLEIKGRKIEAFNAASKTNKCLQLAAGAIYHDRDVENDEDRRAKNWSVVHDVKIEALRNIIEEANGTPLIVAYNFKSDLARLKKAFPRGVHYQTNKHKEAFKRGEIDLLFIHPASAGHGVDGLQYGTNMMVFFSRDWNLDNYDQLLGRINPVRQFQAGFDRPVFIWHILARGTMDEEVDERHISKREVQDILLEAMKAKKM